MRQAVVALLAVPILVAVYVGALLRRSTLARAGLALGLAVILGIGVIGAGEPKATVAVPPTVIVPLTQAEFTTTFSTGRGLAEPVTIRFSTPMDPASVAASLVVEPATAVDLAWDATESVLTVAPRDRWAVGTLHTVTVQPGALARSGQPLARPARAAFLTRTVTTASAAATQPVGKAVSTTTAFEVSFAAPIDPATVTTAVRLDPPTQGVVLPGLAVNGPNRYTFVPSTALLPDTDYRLVVSGVRDLDGVPLDTVVLAVHTTKAPGVVRFRPRADTKDVARDAAVSVRFTASMDRATTGKAFKVSVAGKVVAGKIRWAEADTVIVFTPTSPLPYGSTVSMVVTAGAESATGIPIAAPVHAVFQTAKKPAASTSSEGSQSSGGGGGSAVGGGSWAAVETYYLGLMNCTRTGGWVTSTGACSSPGGRNVAPLKLSTGISSKVSRPYAKLLATRNLCNHFYDGNPGDRLRRAGYSSYRWAENIGCRSGGPNGAVLGTHLFYQNEKPTNGGHYVNLMNAAYSQVGIGVWVSNGRVRLVVDFYHP